MEVTGVRDINITAIGGGGFTHDTYPTLDDFCLRQAGPGPVHLGFIGAASRDDPAKIARFHARFSGVTASHTHIPMTLDAAALSDHLSRLDMVYVGGGDTEAMVTLWRDNGWDAVLCGAAWQGLAIAGVSAGAVCWFDHFLFQGGGGSMRPVQGLGLITGGACPHYSTETARRAALHAAVAGQSMPDSIALDDGMAVAFGAAGLAALCAAEPGAAAYHITRATDGTAHETRCTL